MDIINNNNKEFYLVKESNIFINYISLKKILYILILVLE